jgi:hypothetical protein
LKLYGDKEDYDIRHGYPQYIILISASKKDLSHALSITHILNHLIKIIPGDKQIITDLTGSTVLDYQELIF